MFDRSVTYFRHQFGIIPLWKDQRQVPVFYGQETYIMFWNSPSRSSVERPPFRKLGGAADAEHFPLAWRAANLRPPGSAKSGPASTKPSPKSAEFGPNSTKFEPVSDKFAPTSANRGPNRTTFGPKWTTTLIELRFGPALGPVRPSLASSAKLGRF